MNDLKDIKNTTGKILSVDFGDVRTGLAVSDISRFLASGIGQISVGGMYKTAARIAEIVKEEGITGGIVIGLPVNMNGTEGPRAERVRRLAELITERAPKLPLALMDELVDMGYDVHHKITEDNSGIMMILSYVLMFGMLFFFMSMISKKMGGDGIMGQIGASKAKVYMEKDSAKVIAAREGRANRAWVERELAEKNFEIIDDIYRG